MHLCKGKNYLFFKHKIKYMITLSRKLQFWSSDVGKKTFRCFQHFSELIKESEKDLPDTISSDFENHLSSLTEYLHEYFPNLHSKKIVVHRIFLGLQKCQWS